MKINPFLIIVILFITSETANAQTIFVRPRPGKVYGHRRPVQRYRQPVQQLPAFEPSVNLSFGYGFPNVDKEALVDFSGLRRGNGTQTGPLTGALDYRFSRSMSIGVLVTHGKVNVPYYDYAGTQAISGSLDNWAFMLNLVRYMPIPRSVVTPYIRTAIGINQWKQDYTAANGNKISNINEPTDLAYQVGIGANFKLSKNAGLFVEAGYGKYILNGGLSLTF